MITKKMYLNDAVTSTFQATILSVSVKEDHPAVSLDKTFFFPGGGGQLNDTGSINGVQIIGILTEDNQVWHVLSKDIDISAGEQVQCQIDKLRRDEIMQQHTGQHILSQSILRTMKSETLSFQMKEDISQISITLHDNEDIETYLDESERLANGIVFAGAPVSIEYVSFDAQLPGDLRKAPLEKHVDASGTYRVVKIGDFDTIPCGGTHCADASNVGLIKIIGRRKQGKKINLEFVCGTRALRDYQAKVHLVSSLSKALNTHESGVYLGFCKLVEDVSSAKKSTVELKKTNASLRAADLIGRAESIGALHYVYWSDEEMAIQDMKSIARNVVERPGFVCMIGNGKNFLVAKSDNVNLALDEILEDSKKTIDGMGFGGRAMLEGYVRCPDDSLRLSRLIAECISV